MFMGKASRVGESGLIFAVPRHQSAMSRVRAERCSRAASLAVLSLILILPVSPGAFGQSLNSNSPTVVLTATLPETLTVSASPTTATFTLVPGGTSNANTIAITTSTVLMGSRTSLILVGYFASAAAALSTSAPVSSIPSSDVFGQVSTGTPTSYTAFTQSDALGTAGAGLLLFSQTITTANDVQTRTDNLSLEINLASSPQQPAGTYTGILTLQAQAM